MNVWEDQSSPTNYYYDGDYPAEKFARYPENFDDTTIYQGLMYDVARYIELFSKSDGPVLELCCGTGRVALPLAEAGCNVVGVDFSTELLRQFGAKLEQQSAELQGRITLVDQDITRLALPGRRFPKAFIAFNSLLCIADFEQQCAALKAASDHMENDGLLVIDIVNPLKLPIAGDPAP